MLLVTNTSVIQLTSLSRSARCPSSGPSRLFQKLANLNLRQRISLAGLRVPGARCCGASMEVKVLFFARSRELAGATEAMMSLPEGATTLDLQAQLLLQVRAAACRVLPLVA